MVVALVVLCMRLWFVPSIGFVCDCVHQVPYTYTKRNPKNRMNENDEIVGIKY